MSFLRHAFDELHREDGLLVMARGLGLKRVLAKFLRMHCEDRDSKGRRRLVFCINAIGEEELLLNALQTDGVEPAQLPVIINSELSSKQRQALYRKGGVFLVTSRVLVIDFLNDNVDVSSVGGFLVSRAHTVTEGSTAAFILRLFREKNEKGFVKGFSADPEALVRGFAKVEKVLQDLHVRQLYLVPRFHDTVCETLNRQEVKVVRLEVELSDSMARVQEAIIVAMQSCLKELKRAERSLEGTELTVENSIFKSFDASIKRQLAHIWHRVSWRTRQLVADLRTLRELLEYMVDYDCVTFYSLMLQLQSRNQLVMQRQKEGSLWITSEAGSQLLQAAKARVFRMGAGNKAVPVLAASPKWGLLEETLGEINQEWRKQRQMMRDGITQAGSDIEDNDAPEPCKLYGGGGVLVLVKEAHTRSHLRDLLTMGSGCMLKRRLLSFITRTRESSGSKAGKAGAQSTGTSKKARERASLYALEAELLEELGQASVEGPKQGGKKRKRPQSAQSHNQQTVATEILQQTLQSYASETQASDAGNKSASASGSAGHVSTLVDDLSVCILTAAEANEYMSVLEDIQPTYVVMYDPDMSFLRTLETFQATREAAGGGLKVYFMQYVDSAEAQRFVTSRDRETEAFNTLIFQKSHMVIHQRTRDLPPEVLAKMRQKHPDLAIDTRTNVRGVALTKSGGPGTIVVDTRELRSMLPSLLHKAGFILKARTILVGDYVLTPDICVERKSVSDLFSSFASGRLYNQAEAMSANYATPVLMIEFQAEKAFVLEGKELPSDIESSHIISKLTLLASHFPRLRIIWSRSPHATVTIFKDLKRDKADVDLEKALKASGVQDEEDSSAMRGRELLLKLPGVTQFNVGKILNGAESVAALTQMSEKELEPLAGTLGAKKLYAFFREPPAMDPAPSKGNAKGNAKGKVKGKANGKGKGNAEAKGKKASGKDKGKGKAPASDKEGAPDSL
ncbi:unnamed protein product [Chrysoparadoxa australica]